MTDQDQKRAGAILEIDLEAVAENWRRLSAKLAAGASCAGVVKADGYGLGAAKVGRALAKAGCRLFFVATLGEGIALRRALPEVEIAVLNGLLPGTESDFAAYRLMPVLNDLGQIANWKRFTPGLPAMVQIDTGMARLGLPTAEVARLEASPELLAGFPLRAVMSHLACSDERDHDLNARQLATFEALRKKLPPAAASLAASSGIFLGSAYHFDFVRPGAALYGVNPTPDDLNPMVQVVHLKGKIIQTREIDRDSTVGYGATHRMDEPGRIATVAVGYADGWLRSASNRGGFALLSGHKLPIIGRISMDLMTLDATGLDPALCHPGAFVELIGENGVDAVGATAGTIGYEVLTSLGRRYHRVYKGEPMSDEPA